MDSVPLIWIVEDDASTQRMVVEHLKAKGFKMVVFESAENAYAALRSQTLPTLIILDMLLPGMSGVDLIRLIKQNPNWEKIPIVVVSVLSRKDSMVSEGEDKAAFWVNKPFDAGNLVQTVEKVLLSVGQGGEIH